VEPLEKGCLRGESLERSLIPRGSRLHIFRSPRMRERVGRSASLVKLPVTSLGRVDSESRVCTQEGAWAQVKSAVSGGNWEDLQTGLLRNEVLEKKGRCLVVRRSRTEDNISKGSLISQNYCTYLGMMSTRDWNK